MSRPGYFVRHRIGLRWTFGVIAALLIIGAGVCLGFSIVKINEATAIAKRFRALPSAELPSTSTIRLEPGLQTVWIERVSDPSGPTRENTVIGIRNPTTKSDVPITFYDEDQMVAFTIDGAAGNSIGSVVIPTAGSYEVITEGSGGRRLIIGNANPGDYQTTMAIGGGLVLGTAALLVLAVLFLTFMVLMLVLARKPKAAVPASSFVVPMPSWGNPDASSAFAPGPPVGAPPQTTT